MEIYRAYCSACDQEVRVTLKPGYEGEGVPSARDAEAVVCLEHGERCTGEMCPVFDVPTERMKAELEELEGQSDEL